MKFQTSKLYLHLLLFTSLFILHSCGVVEEPVTSVSCSGDCSGIVSSGSSTGVFVDSAVAGVTYTTSSGLSGTTNANGQFSYASGDTASFSIGDVSLGSVTAASLLNPPTSLSAFHCVFCEENSSGPTFLEFSASFSSSADVKNLLASVALISMSLSIILRS